MSHFEHVIRPVSDLIGYAKNARTHSPQQVSQIAASIKEFGFTNPLLIDETNGIIAGHGRVLGAKKAGMRDVPCIIVTGLTETQKRALVLADNQLTLNGGWDTDTLVEELGILVSEGFDVSGIVGFSDEDLAKLIGGGTGTGLTDEDAIPEPPVHPVSQPGDVWILGRHRLVCGDSTDALVVEKCLNGVTPHLMVTDPPYGVAYDPAWRGKALKDGAKRAEGMVSNDGQADWREAWALFPGEVAYVWHGMLHSGEVVESLSAADFEVRAEIIWVKNRHVLSRGHYHPQHESCWYAVKKGGTGHWAGDRKQTTVWQIDHMKSDTGHGTQKPVEAMRRPVLNNSSPGHAVYEPFNGSGTTVMACESTGRCAHAIEIDPTYVDVAVKRWSEFTGLDAVHEETGKTFAEMALERPFE
jgi:DNA modification methylase